MDELKNLIDYIDSLDNETIFKNIKALEKQLQEQVINALNYELKTSLKLNDIRLYCYRKITRPQSLRAIKRALESVYYDYKDFYINNEPVYLLDDFKDCKKIYQVYLNANKPEIYYKDELKIVFIDAYFIEIYKDNKLIKTLCNEDLDIYAHPCKYALSLLRGQIDELYK